MAVLEVFLRTSQTPSINDNKNPKMGNIHVAKPRVIPRNQYYAEMFKPCMPLLPGCVWYLEYICIIERIIV